jgi:hypothetical protein
VTIEEIAKGIVDVTDEDCWPYKLTENLSQYFGEEYRQPRFRVQGKVCFVKGTKGLGFNRASLRRLLKSDKYTNYHE